MKADATPDSGGGPERDELRAMLRHWKAPAAPPEIEDELSREFRRRRAPQRRALWISLATAATLLVAWQTRRAELPPRPAPPLAAVAVAPSPVPPALAAESDRAPGSTVATRSRGARRRSTPPRAEAAVIVEPAQDELLTEFARSRWGMEQAAPGTALQQMPAADAPRYGGEWETVAGEWPLVQRFVPNSGR